MRDSREMDHGLRAGDGFAERLEIAHVDRMAGSPNVDPNDLVMSGGFSTPTNSDLTLTRDDAFGVFLTNSWEVALTSNDASPFTLRVDARCFDLSP